MKLQTLSRLCVFLILLIPYFAQGADRPRMATQRSVPVVVDYSDCARAGNKCPDGDDPCPPEDKGCSSAGLYKESHALLIGASDYRKGWNDLPGVPSDIAAVETKLKDLGFFVHKVMNPDRTMLDNELRNFINKYGLTPRNRLLIYFAGHGATQKMEYGEKLMGYIVPIDAPLPERDLDGFRRSALSMESVQSYARQIQSTHALFVFDSCFSGSVFRVRAHQQVPVYISTKARDPVRYFITAGTENQTVPDVSVFRGLFVRALDGEADLNRDGYVTGTELGAYLNENVTEISKGIQKPEYGPLLDGDLSQGDIIFDLPKQRAFLTLNSLPQSSIRIDGLPMEDFPVIEQALRAGKHMLLFKRSDGSILKHQVQVEPGQSVRCLADFTESKVECRVDDRNPE